MDGKTLILELWAKNSLHIPTSKIWGESFLKVSTTIFGGHVQACPESKLNSRIFRRAVSQK